jgi:hypothetical protein
MTQQEHELMVTMFARVYEAIGMLTEALKSRGVLPDDDERAFAHLVHSDPQKVVRYLLQAQSDYSRLAKSSGVATGLDELPEGAHKP